MSEQHYDIIFRGDIVFGHQLADVKLQLQQLFKADAAKIETLFSGKPVPLKRSLDLSSAHKYRDALIKAGAQVELAVCSEVKIAQAVPAASVTAGVPVRPAEISTQLVETSEAQKISSLLPAAARSSWSLAPVGSSLLQAAEHPPVIAISIDTSSLSLRAVGGNLLDVSEQPQTISSAIIVPNFELAEVGADLVRAEEKILLPLMEVDVGDWDIAELGADLISASEKEIAPVPVIHIIDVGLAPVGADLGQIKQHLTPLNPDISGLSLAK